MTMWEQEEKIRNATKNLTLLIPPVSCSLQFKDIIWILLRYCKHNFPIQIPTFFPFNSFFFFIFQILIS